MKRRARQQEFGFVNHGGKRCGAGRKPKGERAGVPHRRREELAARHPVLITMKLRPGLRSLRRTAEHAEVQRALSEASSEGFRVIEYSVQSNHLHLLAESKDERSLGRGMIGLGVRIARSLNKLWERFGQVFPDRYHARVLKTPRAVRTALVYVLQNARKHGSWWDEAPDPFSSGSSFDGWRSSARSDLGSPSPKLAQSSSRFLSRARTWLLNVGWRRLGLIDPREAPVGG
jgi:REP element-mobilizing transposase RayT